MKFQTDSFIGCVNRERVSPTKNGNNNWILNFALVFSLITIKFLFPNALVYLS